MRRRLPRLTSRANCGACGNLCAAGEVCNAGACEVSCGAGLNNCAGACRDLQPDRAHCGACGLYNPGEICTDGGCEVTCLVGLTACDEQCVDTTADVDHCGGCGLVCGPNVVRNDDGDLSDGLSCQDSVCQCIEGALGQRCEGFVCGDGLVLPGEACDDSNLNDADGCSAVCAVEPGYACNGAPSVCSPIMGDGLIRGDEVCDDENMMDEDGCSALGVVENGYLCEGSPAFANICKPQAALNLRPLTQTGVMASTGSIRCRRSDSAFRRVLRYDHRRWGLDPVINADSADSAANPPDFRYNSAVWSRIRGCPRRHARLSGVADNTELHSAQVGRKRCRQPDGIHNGTRRAGDLANYSSPGAIGAWETRPPLS